MEIIGLSPEAIAGLSLVVMVIMQLLKYFGKYVGVVDEETSTAAQRIVVAVLSGATVLLLNWTNVIGIDFANGGVAELVTLATTLFAGATAAYHLVWDTVVLGVNKLRGK
jgi:hypothetical protein